MLARALGGADRAQRHQVAGAHDAGHAGLDQPGRTGLGAFDRVPGSRHLVRGERDARALHDRMGGGDLAVRRHVVGRSGEHADPRVAEREEVPEGLLDGDRVVARDPREPEALDRRVDQHRRQLQLGEARVVAVRRVLLGVQAAGEHDPRDLLLEQQLDVLRLRHAARGLGAQDRREPALRERDAHDLGQRREDRVLELRQHEADEARALAPELGRPLVAHDVERGEHRLTRGVGDPGLAVEHAAHRGLAHADLARHLGESSCHAVMLRKFATAVCRLAQADSRGMIWRCRCATTRSPRPITGSSTHSRRRSCGCSARSRASPRGRACSTSPAGRASSSAAGPSGSGRAASASTSARCSSARRSRGPRSWASPIG